MTIFCFRMVFIFARPRLWMIISDILYFKLKAWIKQQWHKCCRLRCNHLDKMDTVSQCCEPVKTTYCTFYFLPRLLLCMSLKPWSTWSFCHLAAAQNKSLLWLLSSHINFVIAYTRTIYMMFDALALKSASLLCALMLWARFRQTTISTLLRSTNAAGSCCMQTVPLWPMQIMTMHTCFFGFVCIINYAIICCCCCHTCVSTLVPIFKYNLISTSCLLCRTNCQRQINVDVE